MRKLLAAGALAAAFAVLPSGASAASSKPGNGKELFKVIRFDFGS